MFHPQQEASRSDWLPGRATPFLLLTIVALGGFLRLYQIGSKGLWLDEAFSVWLGWQPVGEMLDWLVKIDQHPPLYYTLLHFWIALTGSDDAATVRALSALLGTLTIPVIYLLGRRLTEDSGVGLLAALVLDVSPFHVRFAQETRMYTLLALNASLALYGLVRLLTVPRSARWVTPSTRRRWLSSQAVKMGLVWLGYVVFTTATLLSHNTAVFFPIAVNVFVLGMMGVRGLGIGDRVSGIRDWVSGIRPSGSSWVGSTDPTVDRGSGDPLGADDKAYSLEPLSVRNWLLAQVGVFLLWSPWLVAFVAQSVRVYREFWLPAPTWETIVGVAAAFLSEFLVLPPGGAWVAWGLYAGLALLGLIHLRHRPGLFALLLVVSFTPFTGEWLVSLRRPIFYDRTLIWASIPLYLLLAAGIRQLHRWCRRLATRH